MFAILNAYVLVGTKSGAQTLKVKSEDGSEKAIHSLYDPLAEAKSIVSSFEFDGRGILVVLGLGLGYHVAELSKKYSDAEILVVEAFSEIREAAKEHGPPLDANIKFIAGLSAREALNEIAGHQIKDGIKPLYVFALSSEVSAFPSYYQPILSSLKKTASIKLWERLRYPKFRKDKLKVILIDSGYFLVKEAGKALTDLGHDVFMFPVKNYLPGSSLVKGGMKGGYENEGMIRRIVETILKFKPDFIMTMNHLGFDEEGTLTSFLRSIEIPVASWYVDSPNLILRAFGSNVSQYVSLFIWDRSYINDMREIGFDAVEYLPLGTDTNIFRPMRKSSKTKTQNPRFVCDVGFVGNSMIEPVEERMTKIDSKYHWLIEKMAVNLASSGIPYASALEALQDADRKHYGELNGKERTILEAAVLWKATLLYRLECIKMLGGFDLHIHGDRGWNSLLDQKNIKILRPLNYYTELPMLYNTCKINFNATSRQMKEAVNQRVLDVPACGAFLLTDYQKSLEELFEVDREIIAYKEKDEIPGLVKYYLDNPDKRETVAKKGLERVLKEHTYMHRLDVIIHCMRARYA